MVYVSLRADLGIKALLAGEIDYSYSTGTIIRGAILGVPVRNLSFDFSRVMHSLMSRPEIPNDAALRGKRVGVSSFGATGDLAARVALRSLGLDPEKDVTIITLGDRHPAPCGASSRHRPGDSYARSSQYSAEKRRLSRAGLCRKDFAAAAHRPCHQHGKNSTQPQSSVSHGAPLAPLRLIVPALLTLPRKSSAYSKEVMYEAYEYLVAALSHDGFVEEASLQAGIDEAKTLAKITKPVN